MSRCAGGRCAFEMKWRLGPLGHAIMIGLGEHLVAVSQGKLSWALETGSRSACRVIDTSGCQAEERPRL